MIIKKVMGLLLLTLLMAACSDKNDDNSGAQDENEKALIASLNAGSKGMYDGVWSISYVPTDTMTISFGTHEYWGLFFYEFPFTSITSRLLPELAEGKVTFPEPKPDFIAGIEVTSEKDEALYNKVLQKYSYYGNYLKTCIVPNYSHPLTMVGYSFIENLEAKAYFEWPTESGQAYRYLPYVVTRSTDAGTVCDCVVLDILPQKSTVTVNAYNSRITCILTIARAEIVHEDGSMEVKDLGGNIELKFTSNKRIESW